MHNKVDILENEIIEQYPEVLDILLRDHTTQKNIFWGTENHEQLGQEYSFEAPILANLITGKRGDLIMPRVQKDSITQHSRVKKMAEVFTPSWICNAQNNLIDNSWFERKDVFNKEIPDEKKWKTNYEKIKFSNNKTWKHYIRDKRLEMACGEAPYITSRYDTTTGVFISIQDRIGLLDRKLRVINENVSLSREWLRAAQIAYKSTYAYEWQGDSLLLARETMLFTFIENYKFKFNKEPLLKSVKSIAQIISWNVWQMDGLKGVVPNSCKTINTSTEILFGIEEIKSSPCIGCQKDEITNHNGKYCLIKDWQSRDLITKKIGKKIRFIDLIKK